MATHFRTKYKHIRLYDKHGNPKPKGGTTICQLIDVTTGEVVVEADAQCHSSEHYNKRIGREVTFGRAMKKLHEEVF